MGTSFFPSLKFMCCPIRLPEQVTRPLTWPSKGPGDLAKGQEGVLLIPRLLWPP